MNKSERYTIWYQYSVGTYYNGATIYHSNTENFETQEDAEDFLKYLKEECNKKSEKLVNWQITKYSEEVICNNEDFDVKYD